MTTKEKLKSIHLFCDENLYDLENMYGILFDVANETKWDEPIPNFDDFVKLIFESTQHYRNRWRFR